MISRTVIKINHVIKIRKGGALHPPAHLFKMQI